MSLPYTHFFILMRPDKRLAAITALGIDGEKLNAAVAKVLGSHFWPFVEGPRADEVRTDYKKHSASRPAGRLLAGDSPSVPAALTTEVPSDSRTLSTELVAKILDELTRRHELADEDLATRAAEVRRRVGEQQALAFYDAVSQNEAAVQVQSEGKLAEIAR